MKILKPYLIGQITANPITYIWRQDIEHYISALDKNISKNVDIINPCGNKFSEKMLELSSEHGDPEEFSKNVVKNKQSKLLPAIDKAYVKEESNCAIFNANHYSPETPFLGTLFELAWYHDQPWKPVIGIYIGDRTTNYLCKHPFVEDTVHTWVSSHIDAIKLLLSIKRYREN